MDWIPAEHRIGEAIEQWCNRLRSVLTLDFSEAFDTVRHAAVMEKLAQLTLPDPVYNWIADFFQGHSHCTKFAGEVSELADIFASVIQGSGLGPAAFLVTAADLRPTHEGNELLKYADDTYLVVPAANIHIHVQPNCHTSKLGQQGTTSSWIVRKPKKSYFGHTSNVGKKLRSRQRNLALNE